ncbi:MAG: hypothetical protein RMJ33_07300 [Saprospiraceae bacterium]|nr:hypothetical protein [Saprospiraceae bacterium]MDW8229628.1 hypothetical protein [Saprospiraceae bacterium]
MKNAVKPSKPTPADVDNPTYASPAYRANHLKPSVPKTPGALSPEEEFHNEPDPDAFRAFLRDYLPNPKAPKRLKAWIRELPYREPKSK